MILALPCLSFALPKAQAVVPPPDGGYPNFTTAEGTNALKNLTTGAANTATGWYSLFTNSTASFNTGLGAGTLALNNTDSNTAVGTAALLLNTTGTENVAVGTATLVNNDSGSDNNAVGAFALQNNDGGSFNNALGRNALSFNVNGSDNTALGDEALKFNTGNQNTALGSGAGFFQDTGDNNIYIGSGVAGVAGESNTIHIGNSSNTDTYISGISGQTAAGGVAVFVNSDGKLGTLTSAKRFKDDIQPMDKASEAILALKPVTFRYKKEIDPKGIPQFGLVAEDVDKVNPDLVARDSNGNISSVRYEQVNAMLLNEFLKEHKKIEKLEATVAGLVEQLRK